ncbi:MULTISPECIES: DNA alkylation repair protein [Marivita]|uniref:DNA alkylation repair protein n=1 Tax=Marivita cryptomonadis TaxID=505252 RepID=A0A9Q2NT87_9RHOB|nr:MULTISPECIES: DNA alkylation repair protein [Marivita]MCR9169389.1 DNA alkylation repair protein [Paracoccaceae bacterium]MBM2322371.1 DNA alkylation repair protein [Marivita cryptomonadis]MBM2331953.1 DNA alkylation repair protein [Marivita cryptomonadis]MBM2341537.1 DNA alkylation repair protein [Marivita cryptomonadis]MBM2346201.1 DNA alkylation repair protein [Marivita cryptomonadis]
MTLDDALAELRAKAEPGRAEQMAAYHKVDRPYLGVANPNTDMLVREWRQAMDLETRLMLAHDLWQTNIFEARVAAAKLLTQARIKPSDESAWDLITSWVPDFDSWAIADHACMAGQRRLTADPTRLDVVETWITSDHMWSRRAALVITLPWTKQNHPTQAETLARDRILGWASTYVTDPDWFIQKAVAWWLRDLSKHDPDRTRAFLATYGDQMKSFARKEASRHLPA